MGLGSVPAWLRPYHVLSNGERFRADLARLIAERPARAVVDEFSSVVDRQIARIGAMAFAKASPGRNRYRYRQQFGIVVICDSERAQEAAYRRLQRAGFKQLKVVTV